MVLHDICGKQYSLCKVVLLSPYLSLSRVFVNLTLCCFFYFGKYDANYSFLSKNTAECGSQNMMHSVLRLYVRDHLLLQER